MFFLIVLFLSGIFFLIFVPCCLCQYHSILFSGCHYTCGIIRKCYSLYSFLKLNDTSPVFSACKHVFQASGNVVCSKICSGSFLTVSKNSIIKLICLLVSLSNSVSFLSRKTPVSLRSCFTNPICRGVAGKPFPMEQVSNPGII